ncbi:MAG: AmmeMemoRadiSam system protein B [Clostridia bacterium]|nr:AmmeMemoRadiSam system protein B [Clostridia bacterium]
MRSKASRRLGIGQIKKKMIQVGLCLVWLIVFSSGCSLNEGGFTQKNQFHEQQEQEKQVKKQDQQSRQYPPYPSFLTEQELYEVLATPQKQFNLEGTILGGVVPHHLVAGSLITDLLAELVPQKPEVIILVGPNHYNLGARMITGFSAWQTPVGLVEVEENIVQALLEKSSVGQDEQVLGQEHSIGSLVPLIKHYLPQTKIAPLILHHDVSLQEVDRLLEILEPELEEGKCVFLASVDFSHYLTRQEAEEKDRFTLKVMENFAYPTLFRLDNDYLDSPATLAMVFRYAESKGLREFQVLANTNSGQILQNDLIATTSYFSLVFLKSDQA